MRRQWGYMLDGPGFTNSTLIEGFRMDGDIRRLPDDPET